MEDILKFPLEFLAEILVGKTEPLPLKKGGYRILSCICKDINYIMMSIYLSYLRSIIILLIIRVVPRELTSRPY